MEFGERALLNIHKGVDITAEEVLQNEQICREA